MTIKCLNPYLMFNGEAADAIALYQRALGATLAGPLMRYGDVPGQTFPEEVQRRVMHARLEVNGEVLMVSDSHPDNPVPRVSNLSVALDFDDLDHATRVFEALAAGGKVTVPLHDTFWGAVFGALDDPFGVAWMFNCQKASAGR